MPTRRSKEPNETRDLLALKTRELIARLEAIAFSDPPYSEHVLSLSLEEVRMLLAELKLRTSLAAAAFTARIQRRSDA